MKKEYNTATNIKNRSNRENVERVLRIIIEKLKTEKDNTNGIFIFAGVERGGNEILEIIKPEFPSSLSYYRCDNKFHTWLISDLLKKDQRNMLLVLVYGDYYCFYEYGKQNTKKIYENDNRLVKRQRKGGQSSVRFSRLAEESRQYYIENLRDKIHKIILEKNLPILIDGGHELAEQLYSELKEPVKILKTQLFPEHKEGNLHRNKGELDKILEEIYDNSENKINEICQDFLRNSELYLLGCEELLENRESTEIVLCIPEKAKLIPFVQLDKLLTVPHDSKSYAFLLSIGGILAKKYY